MPTFNKKKCLNRRRRLRTKSRSERNNKRTEEGLPYFHNEDVMFRGLYTVITMKPQYNESKIYNIHKKILVFLFF